MKNQWFRVSFILILVRLLKISLEFSMPSKIKFKQSTLSHSMHLILKCRVYLNLFVAAYC